MPPRADRQPVPVIQGARRVCNGSIEKLDADDFLHISRSHCSRELITSPSMPALLIEHLPLVKGASTGL